MGYIWVSRTGLKNLTLVQIERDMANLWFSLSESEKDATKHETKAGVEISQCKMTNWPYLAQFA